MTPDPDDDDDDDSGDDTVVVNSLAVEPTQITRMAVRGTQQLAVTVDPAGAAVTYSSADTDIATVSDTGLITGIGNGDTVVTVSAGDKSVQIPVSVQIDI